jgi:hypothetical protein
LAFFALVISVKTSALRVQLEKSLGSRIPAPFSPRPSTPAEMVASGIPEIDHLTGGLPRGCLTEISGPVGSGRTSLLVSLLSALTKREESCALVDGRDSFDPCGAEEAGVALGRLLLVRCTNIEQALRAADLLLHGGGFGLVALDLSDLPIASVQRVPLNVWFRFRRMVENTPTVFMLLEQEPCAKTCASLVLRLEMKMARWRSIHKNGEGNSQPTLLSGLQFNAEVMRCRFERAKSEDGWPGGSASRNSAASDLAASDSYEGTRCSFESKPGWTELTKKRRKIREA